MSKYQELYQKHEKHIDSTKHIQKAYKSALYKNEWDKNKISIANISGFKGLQNLPYSNAEIMRDVFETHALEDIILTENVGLWFCTSGSTGNKKWMAWTYNDINRSKKELGEKLLEILKPNDIVMAIVLSSPFLSGQLPYRILESTGSLGKPIEQIIMGPETVQDSFTLLRKRQPTVFICTPSLALRMAEEIGKNTPILLKRMAEEQKSMKLKAASFITKIVTIKPKHIFKRLRLGYFVTESLDPYRKAIEDTFNIEAFDMYGFTEGFGAGFECSVHNGLHFPSMNNVLEIIPEKELKKEEADPTYKPEAIFLCDAEKGLIGELVVTDFKEAIPLIRYRVRDLIKVLETEECSCGNISPKLKILGRTDDIINLGVIRLSTMTFDNYLKKDFKYGKINLWEVFLSRDGFKPKLTLTIEPEHISDEEQFRKEIIESLCEFNIFKTGYDNQLFLFDEIKFVSKLTLEIIGQGKRRKVRYHPNFFKEVKL